MWRPLCVVLVLGAGLSGCGGTIGGYRLMHESEIRQLKEQQKPPPQAPSAMDQLLELQRLQQAAQAFQPQARGDPDLRAQVSVLQERLAGALNALAGHNAALINMSREIGAIREGLSRLEESLKKKGNPL